MMAIFQLMIVLVIGVLIRAEDAEQPHASLLEILRVPDESSVPINYGLPKEEAPEAYYSPDEPRPSTLDLPRSYFNPNYDYPIPSEDLQLPSLEPWNPNNDPKFYYELPAILTRQQQPTNLYPKKFNSDVHDKEKPFSSRPKQELVLSPITKEDYLNKQKDFDKVLLNMEKVQNQKVVATEKVQTNNDTNSSYNEPDTSATTGFSEGFNGHGFLGPQTNNHLITSDLSASSELHHSPPYRQHFHIQGHEGPHSYKWGYDTGKGYNRQFRYEERDKHGHVKGHYGFYDIHGKLQMFHYNADPHHGFNLDEDH